MRRPDEVQVRFDNAGQDGWSGAGELGAATQILWCPAAKRGAYLQSSDGLQHHWPDPLDGLRWMQDHAFNGRWAGYLSYDLGRLFEKISSVECHDHELPLFIFSLHPHDKMRGATSLGSAPVQASSVRSTFSRDSYVAAVRRAIDYVGAGDLFQVNLSQRFSVALRESPATVYERLQQAAPARYGAYLNFGDFALISNSPELFLQVTPERRVTTRPIKGTRPRLHGMEKQLRDSVKDQAELNMIVDLERNDLGRVCEVGSVRVTEPRAIEAHPTVYHGVATIEGQLRDGVSFVDLLRATFPGGSVTGAPKIRAMQIIDELEPVRRGPYCGVIGYIADDGSMEFNVAIRTMIVERGLVHIPVGGGIVADSNPAAEYEETLVKAQAMLAALGLSIDQARL